MDQLEIDRRKSKGAKAIYVSLRDQIIEGVYRAGDRLPSTRALAAELGVSRTTVIRAFEQLAAEGFSDVRQGAAGRVTAGLAAKNVPAPSCSSGERTTLSSYGTRITGFKQGYKSLESGVSVDFRYGSLSSNDFPVTAWKRAVLATMSNQDGRHVYQDPRGSHRLRSALQAYLWRSRNLTCHLDQIVIVNGSQQGIDIAARILLDVGDYYVSEDPGYAMARSVFAATGATGVHIDVDRDGLQTDRLRSVEAKLAYVTPSHQYPLGGIMSIARRHELLHWSRLVGAYVIEDDYDSEYRYDISPAPSLHVLDKDDAVIYLGTVSKTLSPSLRLGYAVVPLQLIDAFTTAKQLTDRSSPTMEQEALAFMLESGAYERHVRRARRRNGERRKTLLRALQRAFGDSIVVEGSNAGLHLVVWFSDIPIELENVLVDEARANALGVYPVSPLYSNEHVGRPDRAGIVMGYAALDASQIEHGVSLLARTREAMGVTR